MLKARQVGTTAPLPERWVSAPKLLFLSVLGVLGWLVIFNKVGFGWVSSTNLGLVGYLHLILGWTGIFNKFRVGWTPSANWLGILT